MNKISLNYDLMVQLITNQQWFKKWIGNRRRDRRQDIIWTDDDPIHCRIYEMPASLS